MPQGLLLHVWQALLGGEGPGLRAEPPCAAGTRFPGKGGSKEEKRKREIKECGFKVTAEGQPVSSFLPWLAPPHQQKDTSPCRIHCCFPASIGTIWTVCMSGQAEGRICKACEKARAGLTESTLSTISSRTDWRQGIANVPLVPRRQYCTLATICCPAEGTTGKTATRFWKAATATADPLHRRIAMQESDAQQSDARPSDARLSDARQSDVAPE